MVRWPLDPKTSNALSSPTCRNGVHIAEQRAETTRPLAISAIVACSSIKTDASAEVFLSLVKPVLFRWHAPAPWSRLDRIWALWNAGINANGAADNPTGLTGLSSICAPAAPAGPHNQVLLWERA